MCALTQCTIAGAKGGAVGAGTGGGGCKMRRLRGCLSVAVGSVASVR